MIIMRVVGARPQFMQECVFRRAVDARGHREILVHTGQHYDEKMSQIFFDELGIPRPDINIGIGSGKHGYQTGRMLEALDDVIEAHKPDALVVDGDTNSTLAGALSAAKCHVPLIHVEAGLRSFDRRMPEEVNRIVADHLAELLCAPTAAAMANLADEGLASRAVLTGDLMYDCFLHFTKAADVGALTACQVLPGKYLLATVHRAENAENPARFAEIVKGLCALPLPVVMPAHPRIHLQLLSLLRSLPTQRNLRVVEPVGYLAMLALELHAACVLTNSGGVQREAYFAGKPSVILRDTSEWREQVDSGWSKLAGADAAAISACCEALLSVQRLARPAIYGDGSAATKVVAAIDEMLG